MKKEQIKKELINELEKWSKIYSFNFQFWPTQKTVYIEKDNVELKIIPDCETVLECITKAVNYIRKINRLQSIETEQRICETCGEHFEPIDKVNYHCQKCQPCEPIETEQESEEKIYKCSFCNRTFKDLECLFDHNMNIC